jgi:hypothetical protein
MIKHSYHYVYKITNLNNGKFYIGKHSTSKLKDNYMGSGTLLKRAIRREGINNFKKEILQFFSNEYDALVYEDNLIRDNYKSSQCYNTNPSGIPKRKITTC